jgi:hypothetical protein
MSMDWDPSDKSVVDRKRIIGDPEGENKSEGAGGGIKREYAMEIVRSACHGGGHFEERLCLEGERL